MNPKKKVFMIRMGPLKFRNPPKPGQLYCYHPIVISKHFSFLELLAFLSDKKLDLEPIVLRKPVQNHIKYEL